MPFAIYSDDLRRAFFYDREQYSMILDCDGHTELNGSNLSTKQKECLDELLRHHILEEADGEAGLSLYQLYRAYDNPYKEEVHWSITGRCNYQCRHCFMNAPEGAQGEPGFDELCRELDAFVRCGIKSVQITGGEPLVHPRFWDIIDECQRRDIRINTIYSNGKLLTRAFMEKLKEKKVFCGFQLSFDGVGWHDWLRGINGAEEAVNEAFLLCREFGAHVSAAMVLHKHNASTIADTIRHLVNVGCYDLKINLASPSGAWASQQEHFLSRDEFFQVLYDFIPQYYEMGAPVNLVLDGYLQLARGTGEWTMNYARHVKEEMLHVTPLCGCIKRNLYVSPKGIVMPCMPIAETNLEHCYPSMLEYPLEDILKSSFYSETCSATVKDLFERNRKCAECEYRLDCCGGCRGKAAQSGYDDFYNGEVEVCSFFRDGWKKRFEEKAEDCYKEFLKTSMG